MNFGSLVQFIHMPHGAVNYKNSWMSYVGEHQVKMLPTAHRALVVSKKRGCMTEPLLGLEDRCRWVQCSLLCLTAMGRLICTFIDERIDDLSTACAQAIQKIFRVCRVRWRLGTKPKPTGEGTWRLMLYAWPIIVDWLNLKGSRSDHAVTNMCWLICRLYSTWRTDEAISWCASVAREFCKEIAPTSASHYLLFLKTLCPTLLPKLG